jgi:hypothetical protein
LRRLKRKRADYVLLEHLEKSLRCTDCGTFGVAKLKVRKMER